MNCKKLTFTILIIITFFAGNIFCQNKDEPLHFNPWEIIIYRPVNNGELNDVWCWLKITDLQGNDVTKTAIRDAVYSFPNQSRVNPKASGPFNFYLPLQPPTYDTFYKYRKSIYLSGGMAMKLNIKPGKYYFSFSTPKDKTMLVETENKSDWLSNAYYYDTENPAKVIFVSPLANDNYFYTGGWYISHKAPKFWNFTIPQVDESHIDKIED